MPASKTSPFSNHFLSGYCPDMGCQTKLVFPSYESSIECTSCGQRHEQTTLREIQEVTDPNVVLHNMLRNILLNETAKKRGTEAVKVLGLSNYHCKLLAPILTSYGMDKKTGKAKLLKEMNQNETFDCGVLCEHCFLIDPEHVEVVGYGRDISGSTLYLADTFATINVYNDNEERLLPIHADGDGHCLVHAVSRALIGRELFWHALRINLKDHFLAHLDRYKSIFIDFIDQVEWAGIIEECNTDFEPAAGELLGLRNTHIFGLANVLRRPIILLDSLSGMQSSGDYAATFLPAIIDIDMCRGKGGKLNKPLCIAWSSNGHNHYIPLVGIKNKPPPKLHRSLVPKVWGLPQHLMDLYIEFDAKDSCTIGGDKCLQDSYVLRLTSAMEEVFLQKYSVHPALVADVHHYVYKRTGVVGCNPKDILEATKKAVQEKRLYVCLLCSAICEQNLVPEGFKRGGALYTLAEQKYGKLRTDKLYPFPLLGVVCSYNADTDELVPNGKETMIEKCSLCPSSQIRLVNGDGSIQYQNGDCTKTRSLSCKCGFKHFWDGNEYDTKPELLSVVLEWGYKVIREKVAWFQHEANPSLNSNAYTIASALVQKHFPGVFGCERLVQKVVDQILEQTKKPEEASQSSCSVEHDRMKDIGSPSKIILSGFGVVHKEELTKSVAERTVRERIAKNAPIQQRRRSTERIQSIVNEGGNTKPTRSSSLELRPFPSSASAMSHRSVAACDNVKASTSAVAKLNKLPSKMVRVVTSDGRQLCLTMEVTLLCSEFFQKLQEELSILPSQIKRIVYGFPPKELHLPQHSLFEDFTLPFRSGDKVSVEIVQDTFEATGLTSSLQAMSKNLGIFNKLQDLQNSNLENLDTAIASLLLTASLSNQSIWSHVQNNPKLFTAGGLLYLQMKRDVGLVDGKHCHLPILPDKVFYYNAKHDRLELCLEPHGHFPIEKGMDEKVLRHQGEVGAMSSLDSEETDGEKQDETPGFSGMFIRKSQQILSSQTPFHGHGYTLKGRVAEGTSASDMHEVVDVSTGYDEQMETDGGPIQVVPGSNMQPHPAPLPATVRMGPGYSVINPELNTTYNSHAERLLFLATQLDNLPSEDTGNLDHSSTSDSADT